MIFDIFMLFAIVIVPIWLWRTVKAAWRRQDEEEWAMDVLAGGNPNETPRQKAEHRMFVKAFKRMGLADKEREEDRW